MTENQYLNKIFKATLLPGPLISPDAPHFTITEVNTSCLKVTCTKETDLIGKSIFESFTDNPEDLTFDTVSNLSKSLLATTSTGRPHIIAPGKYDMPARDSHKFIARYRRPENIPIPANKGNVAIIIHPVMDVTEKITSGKHQKLIQQVSIIQ